MTAPERIWAYSDGLWIEAWDAPPSGAEYIRADLAAVQPAHVHPDPRDDIAAVQPSTVAARWRANGQPDPHKSRYECERASLPKGDMSDDELANRMFIADRNDLDLIVWQTAAKERIRWLSRALIAAIEPTPDHRDEVIKGLVDALERLNAACDAMWNDDRRIEKINGHFTGQQPWQIKEAHMRSISEAQQRLPSAIAAPKLKSCPFCGGCLEMVSVVHYRHPKGKCVISGHVFPKGYIGQWNTRVAQPDPRDEVIARLVEALEFYAPRQVDGITFTGNDDAGVRARAALAAAK